MTPDIVYVVRPGDKNEELRYSLRSLANLPHGRVWIAGYMPKWVTGVGHIPSPPKPGNHIHAKANLKAACEHPEVSETFVYMNDDFFVMQELEQLPVMHRGLLADAIRTAGMASAYTRAMRQTLEILGKRGIAEPLMYDLHAPMLVTKAGMLEALALCSYPMVQERTLFGNLQGVGGEKRHNHKVRRQDRGWSSWPFLSTNDHTFRTLPVGEFIRGRFTERSPYETDAPAPRVPTHRVAPAPRRPIRRHASSTIRRVRVA
jgi:hypothetical protein